MSGLWIVKDCRKTACPYAGLGMRGVLFNLNSTLAHRLEVITKAKKPAW
jgi:hypothetical protein